MSTAQRLILLALVLLAFFPARWLVRELEPPPQAEELLPTDTLLFIHWNDFSRFADGVTGSPLVRRLARKDFPDILRKLGLGEAAVRRFGERLGLARSFHDLPFIPQILRSRGMLALLPNRAPELDLFEGLGASLVFILPEGGGAGGRSLSLAGREPWEGYRGTDILRIQVRGSRSLYACQVRSLSLYAFSPDPIRRCIDQSFLRRAGGGAALADRLRPAGDRLQPERPGEFFAWADIRALQAQPRWGAALAPFWPSIRPRQATLAHSFDGETSGLNAALRFDEAELADWLAGRGLAPPDRPPLAASQDAATLVHLWTNWFTPETLNALADVVNASELGRAVLAGMASFLGQGSVNTEDFHRILAPELGLAVRGETGTGDRLTPLFALYLRARDAASLRLQLKRLVRPFPVRTHRLAHGAEAGTIGMADGMVQPAFAFVGERLVLADNLHMAQQVENQLQTGGEELLGVADQPGAPVSASVFLFLRNRRVAEAAETLLRYLADARDERGAAMLDARQRLFVRELALPFTAALKEAESSRLSLSAADGEVRAAWECRLGDAARGQSPKQSPAQPVRVLEKTKKKPAR